MPIASASTDRDPNSSQILTIFVCNWREPQGEQPRAHFFKSPILASPDFAQAEAQGRALEQELVQVLKQWLEAKGLREYDFTSGFKPAQRPVSLADLGL